MTRPYNVGSETDTPGLIESESGGVTATGHDAMLAMFMARNGIVPASPEGTPGV